ncbi:MAG TPA: hypothetical protein VKG78_01405 [Opitutaceae bacterium]|nr:hypothetical protein [Opitutaceae bacterium]
MKFRFTHAEIAEHLGGLITREHERVKLVEAEIESLGKLRDESPIAAATKSGHADPTETLKQRRREYEKQAEVYQMYADHLIDHDHDLDPDDMELLGLVRSRWE